MSMQEEVLGEDSENLYSNVSTVRVREMLRYECSRVRVKLYMNGDE